MRGWQANKQRIYAQPVKIRAMPENEIPPAMRVDIYFSRAYITEMLESSYEYGKSICAKIFGAGTERRELKRMADEIFLEEHEIRQRHKSADGLVSILNAIGKTVRSEKCGIEKLYLPR